MACGSAQSRLSTPLRPLSRRAPGTLQSSSTLRTGRATTAPCQTVSIGTCSNSPACRKLQSFMQPGVGSAVTNGCATLVLSDESKRGLEWIENEANRLVGPVHWNRVRINENVAALEPTVLEE